MNLPVSFLASFLQRDKKAFVIIAEDGFAAVAAIHDVINGPGIFNAQSTRHVGIRFGDSAVFYSRNELVSILGTDPFTAYKQAWPDAFGVGFYGTVGIDIGLQAISRFLTLTHPLGEYLDYTATIGPIAGLYVVFAPRQKKVAAYFWVGVEVAGSAGNTGRMFKGHGEAGVFETWHWDYKIDDGEKPEFHPFSIGGVDARGALYGMESDGGFLFGAGGGHDNAVFAVGAEYGIPLAIEEMEETAMIANVAALHAGVSFLQGEALLGGKGNPWAVAAAGVGNAGFAATWVHYTYGKK